jgi:polysaccharide biosynthesis/export protein
MNRLLQYSVAVVGVCIALTGIGTSAQAQEAGGAAGTAAPPVTITASEYVIASEDVIEINVLNQPAYTRTIQVNADGSIDYPIVGQIQVVGMKLVQLKQKLLTGLKKRFVNPSLTLAVRARAPRQINIFGDVPSRGKLIIQRDDWKIRDVIAAAGGLAGATGPSDRYEFFTAKLMKAKTAELIDIDLYKLFVENDESQNKPVGDNDTLTIREKEISEMQVQVLGQVNKPGPVIHPRNGSIIDVLQSANGPTAMARLGEVTIERLDGTKEKVDMRGYKEEGFETKVKLRPGDKLIVPENKLEFKLLGRWNAGGTKIYPEDKTLTIFDAVAIGGGATDGAELKETRVTRRVGEEKSPEKYPWMNAKDQKGKPLWVEAKDAEGKTTWTRIVNVEKMLKTGDRTDDIAIIPDDEIYVRASGRRKGTSPQEIFQIVGAVSGIFFLLDRFK